MGKWSDLPLELIECVHEYLDFVDKVRIRALCRTWNSYLHTIPKLMSEELPWLLVQDNEKGASLYSIHEAALYPLNLPELKHKIFKGSSCGWIITLEDETSSDVDDIYAFNPLTRARIRLPPRSSFLDIKDFDPNRTGKEYIMNDSDSDDSPSYQKPEPDHADEDEPEENWDHEVIISASKSCVNLYGFTKVVLSSSPASNDCMAVAIYGHYHHLAWCRPHHKKWTSFFDYDFYEPHGGVADVIFHNDKLHALYSFVRIEIYESIDPQVIVRVLVAPSIENILPMYTECTYLAVCPNLGMIRISRCIEMNDEDKMTHTVNTTRVYVYKLIDSDPKTWVEVNDLGENTMFLGLNLSSSVVVSDKFKYLGYKRNCIYFTDQWGFDWNPGPSNSDIGVFDLDGSFMEGLPVLKLKSNFFWPPPIWVTPSAI